MNLRFELQFGLVSSLVNVILGGISFEGSKTGTGHVIRLNCSFKDTPIATTVEFLVDGTTAFSIRLYHGLCYRTSIGFPCEQEECQCSSDGRRYFWTYHYQFNRFRVTCKAKLDTDCFASSTLLFSADDIHTSDVGPSDDCSTTTKSSSCKLANVNVIAIGLWVWIMCYMNRCGTLYCFMWMCVVFSVVLQSQVGMCVKGVSMSWTSKSDTLFVYCDVNELHSGVKIKDPIGRSYHCTAAIASLAPGYCTQNMQGFPSFTLKQNVISNRTTLTVKKDQRSCENGIWICTHGSNTGENASITVSVSDIWSITTTKNELQIGRTKTLQSFSHLGVLLLTFIATRFLLFLIFLKFPDCMKKIGCENDRKFRRFTVRAFVLIICAVYVVLFGLYLDIYKGKNDLYFILTAFVGCLLSSLEFIISKKLRRRTDLSSGGAMLRNMDIINPE